MIDRTNFPPALPLVSVVIPAFNCERTIRDAIDSALQQTVKAIEILICDDCSTDQTAAIVDDMVDDRIRLYRNLRNLGPGRSRDLLISRARGKFIAFLDADDAWMPERLEKLLHVAEFCESVVAFDDLLICHDATSGQLVPWRRLHGERGFGFSGPVARFREVSVESFLQSERLLIKLMFPARFFYECGVRHSNRAFGEDAEFIFRLLAAGATLRYLPEPLYLYRVSRNSITARCNARAAMRECIEACREMHGWPGPVVHAFDQKIERLKINEVLYELVDSARQLRVQRVLLALFQCPALVVELPRRGWRSLCYHGHRVMHRGVSRPLFGPKE